MDLKQLEFALAVVEEGGFTAAARRLHTVQSTVSSMVSALEKDLGVTLFERTTRQVRLTEPGAAFVPAARRALAAAQEVRTAARATAPGLHGTVTVGTMQGLWPGLQRAMLAMSREHPDVIVELRQAPAAVMQDEVRNGTLDLAVVALTPQQERGLASRLLWQEPMVLVTGRADPLAGDDPVPLSAVASRPFVDFPDGWAVRHEVDRAFRTAKVAPGRRFEVNDLLSAADLVEYNLAVTILPRSLAPRFPRLLVRPIARHVPHWRVMLVYRHGGLPEPVRTFLNLLR